MKGLWKKLLKKIIMEMVIIFIMVAIMAGIFLVWVFLDKETQLMIFFPFLAVALIHICTNPLCNLEEETFDDDEIREKTLVNDEETEL